MSDYLWEDELGDALYATAPLSWQGYEIQRMYEGMGERKDWMTGELQNVARTLRYPEEDLKMAAIWFRLQRMHKETCTPGHWAETDRNEPGDAYRFWTLFYFAYLDYMRFDFNPYFRYDQCAAKLRAYSTRCRLASKVVLQLIGYRGTDPWTSRHGDLAGYQDIAKKSKQEEWEYKMPKSVEALLALSFQANGWAAFRSQPDTNGSEVIAKTPEEVLAKVAMDGLSSNFKYSPDEFERRALFFMLAQRLFIRKDVVAKYSRERALFAVLYLDLYRRPLGDVFIRKSFKKKWESIPFEKKEDFAVTCRKFLVEIRNEAAKTWPHVEEDK